jgi:hypothetical protein
VRRQFGEVVAIAAVPGPTPGLGPPVAGTVTSRRALRPEWPVYDAVPDFGAVGSAYPDGRAPLGSAGFRMGPGGTPTPFPMPYVRPHP